MGGSSCQRELEHVVPQFSFVCHVAFADLALHVGAISSQNIDQFQLEAHTTISLRRSGDTFVDVLYRFLAQRYQERLSGRHDEIAAVLQLSLSSIPKGLSDRIP